MEMIQMSVKSKKSAAPKDAEPHRPRVADFNVMNLTIVCTLREGKTEIWAYENTYGGKPYFQVRKVVCENGLWKPSKGIAMGFENRDDFFAGVNAAHANYFHRKEALSKQAA